MQNLFNGQGIKKLIRKVETLVWDLSSGKLGIQGLDGIYTLESSGEGTSLVHNVSLNPLDVFGFSIPAYAVNTPNAEIELGDIIVGANDILGWVVKKNAASLQILKKDGQITNYSAVKTQIFGTNGYMVVKSLTGLLGQDGASGLQSNLLPLLMMGDDSGVNLDKILPLMLMQGQTGQGGTGLNLQGILPMMMMSGGLKGGNMKDMLPLLMMTGGLGGAQGQAGGLAGMLPMIMMMGGLDDEPGQVKSVAPAVPSLRQTR
jgi:hypothetical protein